MKRIKILIVVGIMATSLVACGSQTKGSSSQSAAATNESSAPAETTTVDELVSSEESVSENEAAEEKEALADPSVDIDLTALSSTLIYSEVFNMMMEPLEYVGKTVKMDGVCSIYEDENTGNIYYACIVQDATQCCSQGLEFVLDEDQYQKEDYPEAGDEIIIKGTFDTYEENGNQYLTMRDSQLLED